MNIYISKLKIRISNEVYKQYSIFKKRKEFDVYRNYKFSDTLTGTLINYVYDDGSDNENQFHIKIPKLYDKKEYRDLMTRISISKNIISKVIKSKFEYREY